MASSPVPALRNFVQRSRDHRQATAAIFRRWTTPVAITVFFAALKLLLHLVAISGYGYYRDELYHLAEAEHLSWGYVELPPLIAFLTKLIRLTLGDSLFAIRIVPAIAGVLLVLLTGAFVRQFGGGRFATAVGCLSVTMCPLFLVWNHLLWPLAFELLFWMGCAYIMVRIIDGASPRLWLLFGVLAGLGIENKHTMLLFGFAMVSAMLLTPERRHFTQPWLWLAGLIALLLFLPNLWWQLHNGWPTLEFVRARQQNPKVPVATPLEFFGLQVIGLNPATFLVWSAGLVWLLLSRTGKRYRVLGLTYIFTFLILLLLQGKFYYLISAYPMLMAAGACARERFIEQRPSRGWMKWETMSVLVVAGILSAPFALPLLPIDTYVHLTRALHLPREIPTESVRRGVVQEYYVDMLPWESMTATVAQVFHRLPPEEQSRTGILTADFAEAAAIDFFGRRYGLPKAMSGNLSYWLWGTHGFSGDTLILVGENIQVAALNCRQLEKAADFYHPYAMPYENGPMYLCRGLKEPLPVLWPRLKNWGSVY